MQSGKLCCNAWVPVDIYRLKSERLRDECVKQGLNSDGPVRELRLRLARQLKVRTMHNKLDDLFCKGKCYDGLVVRRS